MNKMSPLFWPVELKGSVIYVLDETKLPHRLSYIKAKNYQQAVRAIKEMKTRAVGQVLLVMYTLLLIVRKNKSKNNLTFLLNEAITAINSARPTLPFKVLTDMVLDWQNKSVPLEQAILRFLEGLKNSRIKQAEEMSVLLKDGDTILTHCNVSGIMPLIAELSTKQNKKISFYVTETRPYMQGMRLSAWELHEAGIPVTIIADNMVAQVMSEGRINKVIVGADHLAQNGDFANKIGTYQIAILAKNFNIPFYVLCPPPSKAQSGKDIKIEVRPDKELLEFNGVSCAPRGVKGYYPAFDVTPASLVTKYIYLNLGTVLEPKQNRPL